MTFKTNSEYLIMAHKAMFAIAANNARIDVMPVYELGKFAPHSWEVKVNGEHIDGFQTKAEAMSFAKRMVEKNI